ncbi:MAG: hypothetical protein AAF471_07920, partial [Myxococcota bacterium]
LHRSEPSTRGEGREPGEAAPNRGVVSNARKRAQPFGCTAQQHQRRERSHNRQPRCLDSVVFN